MNRWPVLALFVAVLVGALAVDRIQVPLDPESIANARPVAAATIENPDPLTAAWYCPVGSSDRGGFATSTIRISNVADDAAVVTLSVFTDGDPGPSRRIDLGPFATQSVRLSELGSFAVAGVVVEVVGGRAVVSHEVETEQGTAAGVCSSTVSDEWFFAGGSTSRDSKQYLVLMNPFAEDVTFNASFWAQNRPRRPIALQGGVVGGRSVMLIDVGEFVTRSSSMSIDIETVRGRLVVEQLQVRDGTLGPTGAALQMGTPAAANEWFLPAGRAHADAEHRVLIYNPSEEIAEVDIRFDPFDSAQRVDLGLITLDLRIQPGRLEEIDIISLLEQVAIPLPFEFGLRVESANTIPIVVGRQQFGPRLDAQAVGAFGDLDAPGGNTDEADDGAGGDSAEVDVSADDGGAEGAAAADTRAGREAPIASLQLQPSNESQYLQPTALQGIGLSRGADLISTEWVVPWVPLRSGNQTVLAVTAPTGALVEIRVVARGQLLDPVRLAVQPDARAVTPLQAPVPSGPLVISSDEPVAIEVQIVDQDGQIDVIPAVPVVPRR